MKNLLSGHLVIIYLICSKKQNNCSYPCNMSISKIIKTVANIYLCLFGIFWSGCMIAIFAARGFIGVQETLSPFNIGNYIVTAIFLLPYLFLNKIATKVEAKFGEKIQWYERKNFFRLFHGARRSRTRLTRRLINMLVNIQKHCKMASGLGTDTGR